MMFHRALLLALCCVLIASLSLADDAPDYRDPDAPDQSVASLASRGLLEEAISYLTILQEHDKIADDSPKRFQGDTLAFVTPWNGKGYDIAKRFKHKFTYISPVWYLIRRDGEQNKLKIVGAHDVDAKWLAALRTPDEKSETLPSIVPRFFFDGMPPEQAVQLMATKGKFIATSILKECQKRNYQGIVLDLASIGFRRYVIYHPVMEFLKLLSETLHGGGKQLVLTVMPQRGTTGNFDHDDLLALEPIVDKLCVMTYDYANTQRPGPNAPLQWVTSTLDLILLPREKRTARASKIMLGLNFYGNDYTLGPEGDGPFGGGPIVGHEFLHTLQTVQMDLEWQESFGEHLVLYNVGTPEDGIKHVIFYPTPRSIHERAKIAEEYGVGLAIWEIGQGLDFFYDLF